MITTIVTLIVAACMYPLGIYLQHYFSAWKKISNYYPAKNTEMKLWVNVFGLRIINLMLRNSAKICLTNNYLIISGCGMRSLIAPKIFIPYADIKCSNKGYIIKNLQSNVSFNLELDNDVSISLNKKLL